MAFTTQPSAFGSAPIRFDITPWVKRLLIANMAAFLVTVAVGYGVMFDWFAFSPSRIVQRPWGVVTYMFIHGGLWHLLMNMLVLFFFGPPLERRWGSDTFLRFYLVCGLGGVVLSFLFISSQIVGASAACYGIMLAFAMTWPDSPIYIWGLVPIKAKWLVGFLAALSLASAVGPTQDGVAHLAHLGGVVTGFFFLRLGFAGSGSGFGGVSTKKKAKSPIKTVSELAGAQARQRRRDERSAARTRADLDAVDAVLDKISAEGIEALTPEERDLLDRVSRKTRAN